MVTGISRAEQLAMRWHDVDLDGGMLEIRRNYVWVRGRGVEKDTKTHQMRRMSLDPATVDVLRAHRLKYESEVASLGVDPTDEAFLFSREALREPVHRRPAWATPAVASPHCASTPHGSARPPARRKSIHQRPGRVKDHPSDSRPDRPSTELGADKVLRPAGDALSPEVWQVPRLQVAEASSLSPRPPLRSGHQYSRLPGL
jgi:hypothetical protein